MYILAFSVKFSIDPLKDAKIDYDSLAHVSGN